MKNLENKLMFIIKESNLKETFGSASKGGAEGKPFGRPLGLGR